MVKKLEAAFGSWPSPRSVVPAIPAEVQSVAPGLYRLPKDVNQGRVSIGELTVRRDSPDIYALEVMNEILGGSGFTSRITKSVRSNEGLAYSARLRHLVRRLLPGPFPRELPVEERECGPGHALVLEEIKRIREAPVADDELDTIKRNLIETFPSSFASKAQAMGISPRTSTQARPRILGDLPRTDPAVTAAECSGSPSSTCCPTS
jgi:zinc protease